MTCPMCGSSKISYKETVTFSTGRVADVYVCKECGFVKTEFH